MASSHPEHKQRELLGLVIFAIGALALTDSLQSHSGPGVLRFLAGQGAIPVALSVMAVGLVLVLHRLGTRLLGARWYPEAILGLQLLLSAMLGGLHLRLGPESYGYIRLGKGGGLVGWALAELLLETVGDLSAWLILLLVAGAGMALLIIYTPLRLLDLALLLPYKIVFPGRAATPPPSPRQRPAVPPAPTPRPTPKPSPSARRHPRRPRRPAPEPETVSRPPRRRRSQRLPPLGLLDTTDQIGSDKAQAQIQARIIEDTLASFGIPAEVVDINVGPAITQFGVQPGTIERGDQLRRVRVSKIVSLADDLALALSASPIRIEAPVPGRPYLGIEIPNANISLVGLRGVLTSKTFRNIDSPLAIPIGRDVSGDPVALDLHKLPHLLIAGATGSGKSVTINAIICALLLNNTSDTFRLILVDPKRVELPGYNGIPHLVAPVVIDIEHADGALSWLLIEMDERYRTFSQAGVRNIESYNEKVKVSEKLPYFVMIIDELADLMMRSPESIEAKLVRLAQMARATGIHLIIATQRPSVDVVTGLIKANFPARLAFAVTSQIDSRVIIDEPGAEKLLGRGDGLLMTADSAKLRRIQGCFVSDNEIEALVKWWRENAPATEQDPTQPAYPWTQLMIEEASADDMLLKAAETIRGRQSISASALQRLMHIGYTRAARLMEQLEDEGYIGPELDGRSGHEVWVDDEIDWE
ncbi:MAG: DNA translocase FtsK [Chloroflexi bacterium]|nr:DNA translocase FtsK [Chloroflexota bacterium]